MTTGYYENTENSNITQDQSSAAQFATVSTLHQVRPTVTPHHMLLLRPTRSNPADVRSVMASLLLSYRQLIVVPLDQQT